MNSGGAVQRVKYEWKCILRGDEILVKLSWRYVMHDRVNRRNGEKFDGKSLRVHEVLNVGKIGVIF